MLYPFLWCSQSNYQWKNESKIFGFSDLPAINVTVFNSIMLETKVWAVTCMQFANIEM